MSHLLYEGSTLERVLERVQADHGDAARIVAADRARRGGFAGFFTNEVFQVTVEVEDAGAPMASGVAPVGPTRGSRAPAVGGAAEPAEIGRITPRRRLIGAGAVSEVVRRPSARRGEQFAASLSAALTEASPLAALASERPSVVSGLRRHDPPLPVGSPALAGPAGASWSEIRLGHLDDTPATVAVDLSSAVGDANVVRLQPHRVRRASASPAQLGELLAEIDREWHEPVALPGSGVIAVVGTPDEARRAARNVAASVGVADADILVASPNDPSDEPTPDQLAAMAASLRLAATDRLRLVVVEVLPGRSGHDWARVTLAGLAPDHVRLAASANRRADAHVLTITALGGVGLVDVVDLFDVDGTDEPEQFLALGVPVGTVDGRSATAVTWAALVLSARAREAMDDHDRQVIDQLAGTGR